jgi:hypothetical protein
MNQATVQEEGQDKADEEKKMEEEEWTGKTVETFFVTTQYSIKRQDTIKFEEGEETLLGLSVPYFYYMGQ